MTIIVSYVPSPEGFVALDAGIEEARLRQTSLTVINVQVGLDAAVPTFADEKDLDAVRARLDELGIAHDVRQLSSDTDVADVILGLAEEQHAQMIVVGLRRKSVVAKALLGSTAERIMLTAACPVLAVRHTV